MRVFQILIIAVSAWISPGTASAELVVAVARNFEPALQQLADQFEAETGHHVIISSGSTGKLFAQIQHGAPFDIFLAADQARPLELERTSRGQAGSRFTYAVGQLVLWQLNDDPVDTRNAIFNSDINFIAMGNPDLAPYGAAAAAMMRRLAEEGTLHGQIVMGEDVGQAFAFVRTGNADLGWVAKSQILSLPEDERGAYWQPDPTLYPPINQDALLLEQGADNPAAHAFLAFLKRPDTRAQISELGYTTP
ncbi:MAG: molybdate ABC transporter substrate-binding protein [Pseudomonadota bacterium]